MNDIATPPLSPASREQAASRRGTIRRKEQTMESSGFTKLIVAVAALAASYATPALMPVNHGGAATPITTGHHDGG
jgi:hypothetical protein